MKLGLLFSGQGAQKPGMGLDFLSDPLFERIISDGSAATGLDLPKIMASEHDELAKTSNVQPALVAVSYGIYRMLKRDLPQLPVAAMAGLSLGEYAALLASGALTAERGLPLLADRGRYMQEDADRTASTMAAVLNPDVEKVAAVCASFPQVWVANYNSPRQLVIGGVVDQVKLASAKLKEAAAGKRVITLRVSGAFHTPLFNHARQQMQDRLAEESFSQPVVPVISNTTVSEFNAADLAAVLTRQLAVPTHFGDDVAYMVNQQAVDTTLEIGPGKTLSRFAKQVTPQLATFHIGTMNDYEEFLKEQQEWN